MVSTSDSDRSDPQALRTVPAVGNEVPVDSLGADTTARADHRQHRWRIGYSLADLPRSLYSAIDSGRHADSLAPDDLTWILDVQLNGQLIECRRLDRTMAATPSPPSTRPPEPTPDGLLDLATSSVKYVPGYLCFRLLRSYFTLRSTLSLIYPPIHPRRAGARARHAVARLHRSRLRRPSITPNR